MAEANNFDFNFGDTPATAPAGATAPAPAPKKPGNSAEANLVNKGNAILQGIDPATKETYGTSSHDVVFLYMVGNPLVKAKRRVKTKKDETGATMKTANGAVIGEDVPCSSPLGFCFKALKDVSIPQIRVKCREKFGKSDILPDKMVKAGEMFVLTYPELFVFATRPEYSAQFDCAFMNVAGVVDEANIVPNGVKVKFGLAVYEKALKENGSNTEGVPYPVPQIAYTYDGAGAPKAGMRDVCTETKDANGMPEFTSDLYREKFSEYFTRERTASTGTKSNKNAKRSDMLALCIACQAMYNEIKNA